jgi:hypothetical protein
MERNVCNTDTRITDSRRLNRAAKLLREVAERKSIRGAARMLDINPGTVKHIIDGNTTHYTMTPLLYAQIELLHAVVEHGAELSDDAIKQAEHALQLQSELARALQQLRKTIRKM